MSKTESEKRIEMTEGSQYKSDLDEVYGGESPSPTPASGGLVVNVGNDATLDKTWKEINDVFSAGGSVVVKFSDSETYARTGSVILTERDSEDGYMVLVFNGGYSTFEATYYRTDTETGYPEGPVG